MHRMFLKILAIALLMSLAAYGQSLGDVARDIRDKQSAEEASSSEKPKVITNADLPKNPDVDEGPREATPAAGAVESGKAESRSAGHASTDHASADHASTDHGSIDHGSAELRSDDRHYAEHYPERRSAEQRVAERWKRQILAQKYKMANLQARIDQLHALIEAENGGVQAEGPFNRYQARQLYQAAQIQQQLDEQKRKLGRMQEAARQAGMHTTVYDP